MACPLTEPQTLTVGDMAFPPHWFLFQLSLLKVRSPFCEEGLGS